MGLRGPERLVPVTTLRRLVVTPHGVWSGPVSGENPDPRDCNVHPSNYTAFNWSAPPSFAAVNVEEGFSQGEYWAASYTLTAADFPIQINTVDTLFATDSATVQTTTKWTVLVYSGLPSTGTLVHSSSSDGDILPHVVMPPGSNGLPLTFMVDPGDPDQIFVNDDGTHVLSVAFRIDAMNQPAANPCTTGSASCCNAFPAVDADGLAQLNNNWLNGLNCGAFGCPANGGWARFSSLFSCGAGCGCRPAGDWFIRATWHSVNCTPPAGACCYPDGTCQIVASASCTSASGVYRGDGVLCANANCPQPTGACCFSNGNCLGKTAAECASLSGTWLGANTTCAAGNLCPSGACCFSNGSCTVLTGSACTAQGGTYHGNNVTCAQAACPQPTGACCTTGGCSQQIQGDCTIAGGVWQGLGSSCSTACNGACCTSGGCASTTQGDCGIAGGVWNGLGSSCPCSAPCYANCDQSTTQPVVNTGDFTCFLQQYSSAVTLASPQQQAHYANCDSSTTFPQVNTGDFTCFLQKYATGCT
jgi:hypothetical protein